MKELEMLEQSLRAMLPLGTVTVNIIKENGEPRRMVASLQRKHLPEIPENKDVSTTKSQKVGNISVWDVEQRGWRTLKVSSIQSIESIDLL